MNMFSPTYIHSSWTTWPMKISSIGCPETTLRCVRSQTSEDLIINWSEHRLRSLEQRHDTRYSDKWLL